ncbi:protein EARLY-RESPONSIVE TO DEHYDRATION 7, chloroplastic-like isoform X2 [Magnolia sinica]|uniref:protein EARLY-RESPONSIVE TO DEHYDRATION 7, chloroplastic-like isoform X2 n=1 Tax=Magnolia sinica TaxID=86752 RepID=UPI002659BF97|nr:protein EARLY-RESPONSIVE TO DEHYDRATION 7, chloroplastic-like isoform X2 [Magnolia sinica]
MYSQQSSRNPNSLYPEVIQSNPEQNSPFISTPNQSSSSLYPTVGSSQQPISQSSQSSSLYPSIDMTDLAENLFPDTGPPAPVESSEQIVIKIPGAMVHLIDKQRSVELASGEFTIVNLCQGGNVVAVLARVGDEIQWPLAKDEATVKLDDSHYFFSLRVPAYDGPGSADDISGMDSEDLLNYGLTFASKGQGGMFKELDRILENYSSFSVQRVSGKSKVLDGSVAKEVAPAEMESEAKKEMMEKQSAAYWTTLAPNVEDYSGSVARAIVAGSGQLIKGILWCGDATVDSLNWGNELLKRRMEPNAKPAEVSREAMKRMKRVKRVTKMSEKVATGVLSGVVKVSGFFTSSVVNSKAGKKFFSLLPGEIILASLDGFSKVCDAVEVAGKNVLSTSSVVTTGIVSQRYGDQAAELTNEGLDAAGHALGTAWAVFKIRKALNPKSAIKPTTLVKLAAKTAPAEMKARQAK